jgi:hypothetical protein
MIYNGNGFDNVKAKYAHLATEFGLPDGFPTKGSIIYAYLDDEDCSSTCYIVWQKDGQMYEWSGGCCSCNAYSDYHADFDDWGPLRVSPQVILMRPNLDPDLRDAVKCFLPD